MCSIFGSLLHNLDSAEKTQAADSLIRHIMGASRARGRDGVGWALQCQFTDNAWLNSYKNTVREGPVEHPKFTPTGQTVVNANIIGNFRAEPTTEYVKNKRNNDQQPYCLDEWVVAHNGVIANDKTLRTNKVDTEIDSAAIVEALMVQPQLTDTVHGAYSTFRGAVKMLHGSYAILARTVYYSDTIFAAVNYRPLWYVVTEVGVFFASTAEYFPSELTPRALEPYSTACFSYATGELVVTIDPLLEAPNQPRALVIASGGLDSTVAAAQVIKEGYDVELLHFEYGCRAEDKEVLAVTRIADALNLTLNRFPLNIYDKSDSALFDKDSPIAGGEEGAEFAHEWVPARNLVMLSIATAYAEAHEFDYIVLGNNLEEAGAYPDNEPEFVRRFNEVLPFAVGANKRVRVLMPVGDLMKHEIVALGLVNNAPMELTWSCYKNKELHCGKCGPCFMRRTAFEINNQEEVISYD